MPRKEIDTGNLPMQQMPDINLDTFDVKNRKPETIDTFDDMPNKVQAEKLAFAEEPVTIRLEPSTLENAPEHFPCWNNGIPAEVFLGGQWNPCGYLPIGIEMVVKRKTVEQIARAKVTKIDTVYDKEARAERPVNDVKRRTSPVNSMTVIRDDNPRGAAWLTEVYRRNY